MESGSVHLASETTKGQVTKIEIEVEGINRWDVFDEDTIKDVRVACNGK